MQQKIKQFLNGYYGRHLVSSLKTFISFFIVIASLQIEQGVSIGWETFWIPVAGSAVRATIKMLLKDYKE